MSFSAWRGIVGIIHPTLRPGALEEFIRLLPEGIGVVPLFLNIRRGTTDEFKQQMVEYERQIALAAEQGCDVIHPNGAPPFMVQGRAAETRVVAEWETKYKTPIFTSGQNHIAALRALGATKILGATYFAGDINKTFAAYFEDAGFDVLAMDGVDVPFNKVQELSGEQVYAHIKASYRRNRDAEAIYMLGSGWRTLGIVETLEQDLGIPVIHPVPARVWEVQKRLDVNEPRAGFGTLLETLPPLPTD